MKNTGLANSEDELWNGLKKLSLCQLNFLAVDEGKPMLSYLYGCYIRLLFHSQAGVQFYLQLFFALLIS